MSDDVLRVDWGDGVSALDRVTRAIVMAVDGAIAELVRRGFERDRDDITIVQAQWDVFPTWVRLRGRSVYEVNVVNDAGVPVAFGRWISDPGRSRWGQFRNFLRRLLSRKPKALPPPTSTDA